MEPANLLQHVTALKNELDAVDARITYEIGKTREVESAIVLCQDEVRSWDEEEHKWLREQCAFATQADDFDNLKGILQQEEHRLNEEIESAKHTRDKKRANLESQRQEFIDLCKSFQKSQEQVNLPKERKAFEQASRDLQKSIDELLEEIEKSKKEEAERVKSKTAVVEQLQGKQTGLTDAIGAAKSTLAAAKERAQHILKESGAEESDRALARLKGELEAVEEEMATLDDCIMGLRAQIHKIKNEIWMFDNRIKEKREQCERLEQRAKVHEISQISACFEASLAEESASPQSSREMQQTVRGAAAPQPAAPLPGRHRMDLRTHHWTPRGPYRKNALPFSSPPTRPSPAERVRSEKSGLERGSFFGPGREQGEPEETPFSADILTYGGVEREQVEKEPPASPARALRRKSRPQMKPLFDSDDDDFMRPYTGSAKITELEDSAGQSDEDAELLNYQWNKKSNKV